jgi:hypothetical protein
MEEERQGAKTLGSISLRNRVECALVVHPRFPHSFWHIDELMEAYKKRHYQVVEGEVRVLHQQPVTGHSKGDVIVVNGAQFEVNYFLRTPAYRDTIAHGGVLKNSVYTRIYHQDGQILRVDIRQP